MAAIYYFNQDYYEAENQFDVIIEGNQFGAEFHANRHIQQLERLHDNVKILRLQFCHALHFEQKDINQNIFKQFFERCNQINEIHLMLNLKLIKKSSFKNLMNLLLQSCPLTKKFSFYCERSTFNKSSSEILFSSLKYFKKLEKLEMFWQLLFGKHFTTQNHLHGIQDNLVSLNLRIKSSSSNEVIILFHQLSKIINLRELSLQFYGSNSIEGYQALGYMIEQFKFLKSLSLILGKNKLEQQETRQIAKILENCSKELRHLKIDLSYNQIYQDWLFELGQSLKYHSQLHKLELLMVGMGSMDQKTADIFFESISQMNDLHSLVLSHYYLCYFDSYWHNFYEFKAYHMFPFDNILKSVNKLTNLELPQISCSLISVLDCIPQLKQLETLKINIDLSVDCYERYQYNEKQLEIALINLKNVQKLSLIITGCIDQVNEQFAIQVAEQISKLNGITNLSLFFEKTINTINKQVIFDVQNYFIQSITGLKNSLKHFEIDYKFNDDSLFSILKQINNLYSVKINFQRVYLLKKNDMLSRINYQRIINKYPRLVTQVIFQEK